MSRLPAMRSVTLSETTPATTGDQRGGGFMTHVATFADAVAAQPRDLDGGNLTAGPVTDRAP